MKQIPSLAMAIVLALSGAAVVVSAQPAAAQQDSGYMMGPWMMGPNNMMGGPMGPWMMGRNGNMMNWNGQGGMCGMMSYHIDGRLAYLKTELQITDAQEALWKAYADAVRDNSQSMATRCTAMMGGSAYSAASLPERLSKHEQFMAVQLDALRAVDKSLKPLYAALSADQRKVADQLIWCPMGMM